MGGGRLKPWDSNPPSFLCKIRMRYFWISLDNWCVMADKRVIFLWRRCWKSLNHFSLRQLGVVLISSCLSLFHNLNHPQQKKKIRIHNKQINAKQIWKLSKTNRAWSIQTHSWYEEGLFPAAVSFCFGLAVTLRRIKCCFVAAVSCPSPCVLLCMLCTVQRVEGEIKVKATSTGSCSGGTLHAKDHTVQIRKRSCTQTASQEFLLMQTHKNAIKHTHTHTHTYMFAHAGVPFVLSVCVSQWWMSRHA